MRVLHFIIPAVILLGLGTACTNEKNGETVMEGRISGNPDSMNRLILLEDDDVTGPTFSAHVNRHERHGYETESYFVHLTTDTAITDASGETVSFNDWSEAGTFHPNQHITVHLAVGETFTPASTSLPRYVTYQPRFLPAYEAKSITMEPFTTDDLYAYYSPVSERRYQVLILSGDEEVASDALTLQEAMAARMGERERTDVDLIHIREYGLDTADAQPLPHYVLLDHTGVLAKSGDPEDLYDALPEMD